ncbi:DUF550 domain-containing protein [Klebsiella oxytoca]|nr:DUF550 domain-containing protein [Klebsiella oxytoca]MDM4369896.1 DUF550 domain-containing protein [Klebsiella oxytoca]
MTSKLTDSQLLFRLQEFYGAEKDASEIGDHEFAQECADIVSVIRELQEYRLATMNSQPVATIFKSSQGHAKVIMNGELPQGYSDVYLHALPTPEREQVRREHAEWSQATFGNVGPVGPLKHLSKEALEAAADPHDPLEWADMQFLFWDAQRRMGISDEFITRAMVEKLAINKARQWPEPKNGEPRLHINQEAGK